MITITVSSTVVAAVAIVGYFGIHTIVNGIAELFNPKSSNKNDKKQ